MINSLKEHLKEIDEIEDDETFTHEESEAVYEYCTDQNFDISDEDMEEIYNRGLQDSFEFWKESYSDFIQLCKE